MSTGKGKKRLRGIPVLHEEKKTRHNLLITPWDKLQRVAQNEYQYQWVRRAVDNIFGGRRINSCVKYDLKMGLPDQFI